MKKYRVEYPCICYVTIDVDADGPESARELADQEFCVTGFVGNGGTGKLIGVTGPGARIEEPYDYLDDSEYSPSVHEIEG